MNTCVLRFDWQVLGSMSANTALFTGANERTLAIAAHRAVEDSTGPMRNRSNAYSARQLVAPYVVRHQYVMGQQSHQASAQRSAPVCCFACGIMM